MGASDSKPLLSVTLKPRDLYLEAPGVPVLGETTTLILAEKGWELELSAHGVYFSKPPTDPRRPESGFLGLVPWNLVRLVTFAAGQK